GDAAEQRLEALLPGSVERTQEVALGDDPNVVAAVDDEHRADLFIHEQADGVADGGIGGRGDGRRAHHVTDAVAVDETVDAGDRPARVALRRLLLDNGTWHGLCPPLRHPTRRGFRFGKGADAAL